MENTDEKVSACDGEKSAPRRRRARSRVRKKLAQELLSRECETAEVLAELGISEEEYEAIVAEDEFRLFISETARLRAESEAPQIWRALVKMAKGGNVPAIRLYLDLFSARRPSQTKNEPDVEIESLRRDIFGDG